MFDQEDLCQEKKTFIKIDVEGADNQLWSKLKHQLSNLIVDLLETNINSRTGGNVKEEFQRLSTNLIEFANAKLERPSIENQKLIAEIGNLLADRAKTFSETRKINAEAEKMEIENTLNKLRLALGLAKAITSESSDPDSIAFIKNIEDLAFSFQENISNNKI